MTDTISIELDRADGTLQRLIGLVERRGFHIEGMSLTDIEGVRRLDLTVRGRDANRSTDILGRQIDRMIGATRVAAISSEMQGEAAA